MVDLWQRPAADTVSWMNKVRNAVSERRSAVVG
jgi:hypothetical protein